MKSITYKKLLQIENPIIYDVRSLKEYQNFHIKNALHINNYILLQDYQKILKPTNKYYIICQSGHTSQSTALFLRKKGYDAISVQNGYESLKLP